jgi:uncharacterized protein (DUF58 family)
MNGPGRLIPPTMSTPAASGRRWPAAFQSRFFLALLLGLVWMGPAWWNRRILYALPLWDGAVILAWAIDLRRLPRPGEITVSRRWSEPLSLNVDSQVELEVANHSARLLEVSIEDDVPSSLARKLPRFTLRVRPHGSAKVAYSIRPATRGDIHLGRALLRYHGSVQFAERWAVADISQSVRVYPNLREAERYTLYLVRSRQVEQEKRLKRLLGRGRDFESLREYRESDEIRDISWSATARHGKLISKVYQVERSQSVFLIVDAGRLMLARISASVDSRGLHTTRSDRASLAQGTGAQDSRGDNVRVALGGRAPENTPALQLTKLDYAVNAALSLARVALHSGDTAGLVAYGRKLQAYMPAARGAAHLREIVEQLAMVAGESVEAHHSLAAESLLVRHRRRSLVVWITDLAETAATPEVIEAASRLLHQHLVLFAVVGDPELRALATRRPGSPTEMYQYVAAQEIIQRRAVLLRRLREQGALAMEFEPGRLSAEIVNRYLQIKSQGLL